MIYLYSLGAANGLLLAALLGFAKQNGANRVIAIWGLFLSMNFLGNFIYIEQSINTFSFLIGWTYFLPAAYGGLLFLYCQKLLNHQSLTWADAIHFAPLLLCYALNIDILLAPSELKLTYITELPPLTPSFYISQFILYAQAFIYCVASIFLLLQYQKKHREQYSHLHKSITKWMLIVIGFSVVIWVSKLLASLLQEVFWLSQFGTALIVALIYAVGFMQWFKPQLFATQKLLPTTLIKEDEQSSGAIENEQPAQNRKNNENLTLDPQSHELLAKVIKDTVEMNKLYLIENLSLPMLSAKTGISIHHLSETLNHNLNKNFYRYINEYRVEHFCQQLVLQPKATIIDLATASGFANKSTFNAAFKEIKQQTPSQYRKQLKRI